MKSLYDLLQDKKLVESVISIVQHFGYTRDVMIYCGDKITEEENIITLGLVISRNKEVNSPWNAKVLLEAKLSELLNCQVDVVRLQAHNELDPDAIFRKSAPIMDVEQIREKFQVRSEKAIFLNDSEKPDLENVRRADEYLARAAEYLKKASGAVNLSKHAVVCEEADIKKRRVGSSDEADSPTQGNTESPPKNSGLGNTNK